MFNRKAKARERMEALVARLRSEPSATVTAKERKTWAQWVERSGLSGTELRELMHPDRLGRSVPTLEQALALVESAPALEGESTDWRDRARTELQQALLKAKVTNPDGTPMFRLKKGPPVD